MGCETRFLIPGYLCGVSWASKYDVQESIDNWKFEMDTAKQMLTQLAFMTEPKKFCGEENDPAWWIQHRLEESIETIECNAYKLRIAEEVLENWDTMHHKNGGELADIDDFDEYARISSEYGVSVLPDGSPKHYENEYDKRAYKNLTGHDWVPNDNSTNNDTA